MEFKKSKYYDKKFLGEHLYEKINNDDYIFTVYEYFGLNNNQKEYHVKDEGQDYNLKVYEDHYELDCQKTSYSLFLVFDKPVHITGINCKLIIAPMIIIKSKENDELYHCVTNKVVIYNSCEHLYFIGYSKIRNIYFYNNRVELGALETDNFFIFNKDLYFNITSCFLKDIKIKCFGSCDDLKEKLLNNEKFKNGIIHIE